MTCVDSASVDARSLLFQWRSAPDIGCPPSPRMPQVQAKAAIKAVAGTAMSTHEKAINADLLRRAAAPAHR